MASSKQPRIYLFFLAVFALLFVLMIIFSQSFYDWRLLLGGIIFLAALTLCFFNVEKLILVSLGLLPFLAGLENYQINISPLVHFLGLDQSYQIDLFFIARIFIAILAVIEIFRRGTAILKAPLFYILFISALLNVAPFLNSEFKLFGLAYYWFHLISAFGAYFLGYFIFNSQKGYLKIISAICLSSIIPIFFALKQIIFREFFFESDSVLPRLQATFWHPNKFGSFLFIVLTLYLISYLAIKIKRTRTSSLPLWPFTVWGGLLIMTFSRTAWVAFFLAVFLAALIKKEIRFVAIYAGSLAVFLGLFFEKIRERLFSFSALLNWRTSFSLSGRMETWDMAWFSAQKKFWTGYGPGSFTEVLKTVKGTDIGNFSPHSDLLRFALEGGILGFFSYLLYLGGALYYSFLSYWKYPLSEDAIEIFGRKLMINFKLLGLIPLTLFAIMIPYSFMETTSLDFIYQAFAWILLGSWLGMSQKYWKKI